MRFSRSSSTLRDACRDFTLHYQNDPSVYHNREGSERWALDLYATIKQAFTPPQQRHIASVLHALEQHDFALAQQLAQDCPKTSEFVEKMVRLQIECQDVKFSTRE